jgi:protein O-GlcNAc transferase
MQAPESSADNYDTCDELKRIAARTPNDPAAWFRCALACLAHGEARPALDAFRTTIALAPGFGPAYAGLGDVLRRMEEYDAALKAFRLALQLDPTLFEAAVNGGLVLYMQGRLTEAMTWFERAHTIKPDTAAVFGNMALCQTEMGHIDAAVQLSRRCLAIRPDFAAARSNLLLSLCYDPSIGYDLLSAEHREWAKTCGVAPGQRINHRPQPVDRDRPLRIGYVSPDFRTHSVAYFLDALIGGHNHTGYAPYCYSDVALDDALTHRFRSCAAFWRDTARLTDAQLAQSIADDRIDILVDCTGHMARNRLGVFSRTPAPVQATWLGYPFSTGLDTINYRLTDAIADPAGEDRYYSEKLWRLDGCFACYRPLPDAPAITPGPATTSGTVTLGCFNTLPKLTNAVLDLWARIIILTPGSRLFLKNKALSDPAVRNDLVQRFGDRGIGPERLILKGHAASVVAHLAHYGEVDLCLDTFPYNGTTTTCEALWMGVPVVTLAGAHHAGRVGISLLTAVGLKEWIGESEEEYVKIAVARALDIAQLTVVRTTLRSHMAGSPLCDGNAFVNKMEAAYRTMWQTWCDTGKPDE